MGQVVNLEVFFRDIPVFTQIFGEFLGNGRLTGLVAFEQLKLFAPNFAGKTFILEFDIIGRADIGATETADTVRRRLVERRGNFLAVSHD